MKTLRQGRGLKNALSVLVCLFLSSIAFPALGAEYFVTRQGNDANKGTSRETAFATIQKGVDALKPGDTLTIGPGEYFESVKRDNLGGPNADTVIRAEIPGTAVIRGDVPAPKFEKIERYRFVYGAKFDQEPRAVLEHDTLRVIHRAADASELEFNPGNFSYDAEAKMLYISRADLSSPENGYYSVAVNENNGLDLVRPRRVVIEGLAVRGFVSQHAPPGYGICLNAPESCIIRDCIVYMNVRGIVLQPSADRASGQSGADNLIENCVGYGNSPGAICLYSANNVVVRNCHTYKNIRGDGSGENFGVMHYLWMSGPVLFENNISWGQSFNFSIKPSGDGTLKNCVGLGYIRLDPKRMIHNLIGGGNEFDRGSNAAKDNVLMGREQNLDKDFEFADSINLDYRLQSDSHFRGAAPDGSDRGPYQYKPNVFYVSPKGNDRADGLSMRKPWRTLARALKGRQPGDTVYLAGGQYTAAPLDRAGDGKSPIRILGRGRGTVVITGTLNVTGGTGIEIERLNFPDGVALNGSRDVTFNNCTFYGRSDGLKADRVRNLRVTHSVFTNLPVDVRNSSGVFLSGNLYANDGKAAVNVDAETAILYSDYNSYKDTANSWQVGGAAMSLDKVRGKEHDAYSFAAEPEFSSRENVPVLSDTAPFAGRGPNSTPHGIYREYDLDLPQSVRVAGPFVHSVSDTTANIEWWSSSRVSFRLTWGDTPAMNNTVDRLPGKRGFGTCSLTGLKPGTKYYFKLVSSGSSRGGRGGASSSATIVRDSDETMSFTTAAGPAAPREFYVASDGNDENDGLTRKTAFRTINRAAEKVGPGDTVMIAEGTYNEAVRVRAAGAPNRPITFRNIPGEKPVHSSADLEKAFELVMKPDIRIEGIDFQERRFWTLEGIVVYESPRVQIRRCLRAIVSANRSPDLLVKNCVLDGGWNAVMLTSSPNSVVENNVFVYTILRQLNVSGKGPIVARRNIFCECIPNKEHQQLLDISQREVEESDSCFYLRWPVDEKLILKDATLPEYQARTGSNAFAANPMMSGVPGVNGGWVKITGSYADEFFAANPKLILRDIGLQPEAFKNAKLKNPKWEYDRAWAQRFTQAYDAATALEKAGRGSQALAAYLKLANEMPMCDRLKTDILERASFCAERMKNIGRAMAVAKSIPLEPFSIRRQMQLLLNQKKYPEIIASFATENMGGRVFQNFIHPELEDLVEDLYYYRSIAYAKTGNLEAAEKDLGEMLAKRRRRQYRAGEAIQDTSHLRLGDFYRDYLKDDAKALEMYLKVCSRTTWAFWGTPPKPLATGDDEALVKATEAACEILRKQGKLDKVKELRESLAKAQADAAAALRKE